MRHLVDSFEQSQRTLYFLPTSPPDVCRELLYTPTSYLSLLARDMVVAMLIDGYLSDRCAGSMCAARSEALKPVARVYFVAPTVHSVLMPHFYRQQFLCNHCAIYTWTATGLCARCDEFSITRAQRPVAGDRVVAMIGPAERHTADQHVCRACALVLQKERCCYWCKRFAFQTKRKQLIPKDLWMGETELDRKFDCMGCSGSNYWEHRDPNWKWDSNFK